MTKIYIDTNIFLDFYQSAADRLEVFQDLVAQAGSMVLTEQTVAEFHRNRVERLVALAREVKKATSFPIHTTSIVRELNPFTEFCKARDVAITHAKAIVVTLERYLKDESSDPVLTEFNKVVAAAVNFPTSDVLIARASRRKALGNPPTSPDKHTIGDELVWEGLLEHCTGDLVVVSRDKTYANNEALLRREYESRGGRKLVAITRELAPALKMVGRQSTVVESAEKAVREERERSESSTLCPSCGEALETTGFEGSDGDEAWWYYCPKCGYEVFP